MNTATWALYVGLVGGLILLVQWILGWPDDSEEEEWRRMG